MQYANRMEKSGSGIPVVFKVPPILNDSHNQLSYKMNSQSENNKKIYFHQVLASLEGKGLQINETI
jgi:hypothetical protein